MKYAAFELQAGADSAGKQREHMQLVRIALWAVRVQLIRTRLRMKAEASFGPCSSSKGSGRGFV
jgi:hypothetical protein